jgi:sortase A
VGGNSVIQILVCEKLYVTPELKRKRNMLKIYFILACFLLSFLFSYYIYAEYDRNKSEAVSQEILSGILGKLGESKPRLSEEELNALLADSSIRIEDQNVIVVDLNDNISEEININYLLQNAQEQIQGMDPSTAQQITVPERSYVTSSGVTYYVIAIIKVPSLGIEYPVLSEQSTALLKESVCKYWGPNPNEIGNFCIVGHNYKNDKFFSKLDTLQNNDIIELTDMSGRMLEYQVYDKYVVEPTDTSCTSQLTHGKKELTLITCYNNGKQRTIVKAKAIN